MKMGEHGRIGLAVGILAILFSGAYGQANGEIQLVGGSNIRLGRLEFYAFGASWVTVCDDNFGRDEAEVVCRQLGETAEYGAPVFRGPWSDGSGWIHIIDSCDGTESFLGACDVQSDLYSYVRSVDSNYCVHSEDVGVHCIRDSDPEPELRLVGGTSSYSGRVEINVAAYSEWGTINNSNFYDDDAKVICRQLGLPHKHAREHNVFPDGSGAVVYSNLACDGDEERIDLCAHHEYPINTDHSGDVGVICSNHEDFEQDDIRTYDGVMDGSSWYERYFRIQEGAIVKFICSPNHAGGLNTLNDDHATIQWQLGEQDVFSDNIDGVKVDQYIQMYQSNGQGFNGRKGKRLSVMVYTARMEDNLKEVDCEFYDEDDYDSVVVDDDTVDIILLVLPGPEPQHFLSTVTDHVWVGGFVGHIHIPITEFYNSWKIVLEFPKNVFRLYGGNFNIAPEPCLHVGSCTKSKKTWVIWNTYENRVLSPLKDLDLNFVADVSKTLRGGRGRGIVADVKFYGYNKVFGSDYEPAMFA